VKRRAVVLCFVAVLAAGCQGEAKKSEGGNHVTVPVTRAAVLDDTFVAAETADVRDVRLGLAGYSIATVHARRGRGESEQSPLLQAMLETTSGAPVVCAMLQPVSWAPDNRLIDLELRCGLQVDLSTVTAVALQT
jgi:hypothetical protein